MWEFGFGYGASWACVILVSNVHFQMSHQLRPLLAQFRYFQTQYSSVRFELGSLELKTKFHSKVAQVFGEIFGYFKNISFKVKSVVTISRQLFVKIGLLFSLKACSHYRNSAATSEPMQCIAINWKIF